MHLTLIRHGQSYVNLPDWEDGFIDAGLTDLGQQQAQRLAAWLAAHVQPTALYSSTMKRTLETTAAITAQIPLPVSTLDGLREVGNCWPDGSPVDLSQGEPAWTEHWASARPFNPVFRGGETWMDFITRVGRVMADIAAQHTDPDDIVLVVCHGGVIGAALDIAFNIGPWRRNDGWNHNTSITHLEYLSPGSKQDKYSGNEVWRLHGMNICYHLLEPDGSVLGYEWHGPTP
ncbi:histidine phosphatase family protein [Chloroflexota bacterium]